MRNIRYLTKATLIYTLFLHLWNKKKIFKCYEHGIRSGGHRKPILEIACATIVGRAKKYAKPIWHAPPFPTVFLWTTRRVLSSRLGRITPQNKPNESFIGFYMRGSIQIHESRMCTEILIVCSFVPAENRVHVAIIINKNNSGVSADEKSTWDNAAKRRVCKK